MAEQFDPPSFNNDPLPQNDFGDERFFVRGNGGTLDGDPPEIDPGPEYNSELQFGSVGSEASGMDDATGQEEGYEEQITNLFTQRGTDTDAKPRMVRVKASPIKPSGQEIVGADTSNPFELRIVLSDSTWKWYIVSTNSTITDGISGDSMDVSGLEMDTLKTDRGVYVYAEISVNPDLSLAAWDLNLSSTIEPEIEIDAGTLEQTWIRFLIGFVDDDGNVKQACHTAQRVVYAFHNGVLVKTCVAAPTHSDAY